MKLKTIVLKRIKPKESIVGIKSKRSYKRGSELAQTVLITAVMVVVIVTLFFPQIQAIFTTSMTRLSGWFNTVLNTL